MASSSCGGVQDYHKDVRYARLYRAGELVTIREPTEREERVRDLVRCRGTVQREILKSRHYVLKFLARRGLVYREGKNWTGRHSAWLRAIQRDAVLETEDRVVFDEHLALLGYRPDRRIEALALEPSYKGGGRSPVLPEGDLDPSGDGAGDRDRGPPALRGIGNPLRIKGSMVPFGSRRRGGQHDQVRRDGGHT